jgi:cobalt/nickel transport system permease protein
MHISDGVLPTNVAVLSYAVTFGLAAWSTRKVKPEELPKIAVVTSSFFVASLFHIPLGPTSVHLLMGGLVGALLGPVAFISITLGIFLQSILFQFGGLTAVGANSLMMGIPALICAGLFRILRGKTLLSHTIAGAIVGVLGTTISALFLAILLSTAGEEFMGVAKLALAAHVPVIIIEGIVSAFVISFLYRVRPELLGGFR